MTNRETPDRREQIRRVLAEADGFDFASLEPHDDYQQQAEAILALFEPELLRAQAEAHQYRTALQGVARKAAVSVPPPAPRADDQAALRDRIAAAIRAFDFSDYGMDDVSYALEADPDAQEWVPSLADAVLAVLPPTADRAAVIAATARACAEHLRDTYSDMWTADAARSLELHAARIERGEPTALLHRMADKAQQQPDTETQPATCAECDHPHAAHREGDDPVSPGQCSACPDDDAWHDYQADEKPSDHEPGSWAPLWILVDNEPPILPDADETDGGVQP